MAAKFRNAGQTCVCANTFYVHEDVAESFTAKLVARVKGLVVGDGLCPGVNVGPLISPGAVAVMAGKVEEAVKAGAVVAVGGVAGGGGVNGGVGNFFMPTVLTGLPLGSGVSVACQEVFGPIAPIVTFKAGEEGRVVEACNAATVGLAAYIFTRDTSRAWRVGEALGVGMVGINTGLISAAQAPFGGVKESGFGREGAKVGLGEYQSTKYTMWGV
jgi:succinate-semialdehyde dehydrogenase/glutarate-semialdehyde dehydrogenase